MKEIKECPFCGEEIKTMAIVCRYCHTDLNSNSVLKDNKGKFIQVRVKTGEKTYLGDIFVPENFRISDVINNNKRFIVLTNVLDVQQARDIEVGYLAINKERTEWIELTSKQAELSDNCFNKTTNLAA
jgi:hypothetical protein